jgi:L-aminopeptidase/D-esterase-like protein
VDDSAASANLEPIAASERDAVKKPRARDLGLPFPGLFGPCNAVTDVPGVEVGYATLVEADAVRTGVTIVLPRGRAGRATSPVWAGFHALNGNGEMTGTHWIREAGWFLGPIAITNTHGVGMVHHALTRWMVEAGQREPGPYAWFMPIVAETCDAYLNDMNGFHLQEHHVREAISDARGGAIAEGNVGGGTGMICYDFKGGTGTASRVVSAGTGSYMVGALVQANFGLRPALRILGVPVGEHLTDDRIWSGEQGSVIALVATDAPLIPTQLERLARRAALGIGRTGTPGGDGSGDLCLAFSTANEPPDNGQAAGLQPMSFLPHPSLDAMFEATAQAVEEAVVNALVAADTMDGRAGRRVQAIDHVALCKVMRAHGCLADRALR